MGSIKMSDEKVNDATGEVEIAEAARVLVKKKWWALGIFVLVVLIGIPYIFFRAPLYRISNKVYITPATVTGYEKLAEYFPEQYDSLFSLVPNLLLEDLKSTDFAGLLKDSANIDVKTAELRNRLFMYQEHETIVLTYIDNDPDQAYKVDKTLVGLFIGRNNAKLSSAYDSLIGVIDVKLAELNINISNLSEKILTDNSIVLKNEFNLEYGTYYSLIESKNVLTDNKDFFTDRFTIVNAPDPSNVLSYYNKKRDILFVVFIAAALALIGAYLANYIQNLRKKTE
jgi:hypothetical protein